MIRALRGRLAAARASRRRAWLAGEWSDLDAQAAESVMLDELVELHARVLQRIPFVQLLVVAGIGALVLRFVPVGVFLAWAVPSLLVELLRGATARRVLQRRGRSHAARMHRVFIALAALAGAMVGLGAVVFLPRLPIERQAVLGIVLFAMPAAGVAVAVASREILLSYSVCILAPAAAMWALLHRTETAVLPLTAVYLGFLAIITADGESLLMRSVAIRQQRDRMVEALERGNAEVRTAMQRAEDSAQARARVLAAASHDLRQPLHALSLYSALLRTTRDPAALTEVATNVDQIVQSLGNLLNGLLDLSRLSSGSYALELEIVPLDLLASGVCAEFEAAARSKGLALVLEAAQVHARADPLAVARILRNLLDNAIKYTQRGEVRVVVGGEGRDALLSVFDTGRGISAGDLPHVFEEFYQADNPGRDRSNGVGLGLAIVQRLIERMGASIRLESTPGRGSRFTVTLPGAVAADAPARQPSSAQTPDGVAASEPALPVGLRIYLVDDEIAILRGLCALLRSWGAEPHAAIGAPQARALFERHGAPDLLIVDLRLRAGEHGAALAATLQAAYGDFAVLVVSGESASVAQQQAGGIGYGVLQKPLADRVLRQAILDAVARPKTATAARLPTFGGIAQAGRPS